MEQSPSGEEPLIVSGARAEAVDVTPGRTPAGPSGRRIGSPQGKHVGSHRRAKKPVPFWVEACVLVVVALGIALVVHTFVFQAFFIPSGSMENTLHVGDRVLVNRLSYKIGHVQRGQIVVFNGVDSWAPEVATAPPSNVFARVARDVGGFLGFSPAGEKDYIKRVIGLPGDRVQCCDSRGRIDINGTPLDEPYLYPGSTNTTLPFDIRVPPGRLWVEGDHRNDSEDSRYRIGLPGGGTVPENKVVGRAFVVVWPVQHWRWLPIPSSFKSVGGSAVAAAVPYGVGAVAVAPLALLSAGRRRRRRRRT